MRRILWSLAAGTALSTTVTGAMAQDRVGLPDASAYRDPAAPRGSLTFPGARTAPPTGQGLPNAGAAGDPFAGGDARPFPGGRDTLPRAGALTETPGVNLFRREAAPAAGAPVGNLTGRTPIMEGGDFQRVSGQATGRPEDVVHAEYERLPGQREAVEQIRGQDQFREFPAAAVGRPFPSEAANTGNYDAFRGGAAGFGNGGTGAAGVIGGGAGLGGNGSRLADPIPVTAGQGFDRFSNSPVSNEPTRGVTFTRATPEIRSAAVSAGQGRFTNTPVAAVDPRAAAPAAAPRESLGVIAPEVRSGPQVPTLSLEWVTHGGINVGQESTCDLVVKNTGLITASNIEVLAQFPASVRLVAAEPQPVESDSQLVWRLAELQPGKEQIIQIRMIPSERGTLQTRADVRFTGAVATSLTVAEPLLDVTVTGAEKVLVGEPASQTVVVKNPGTGIATNVQIEAIIPEGLEHARGERLVMDIGSLNPGESRSVRLALAAIKGGRQVIQVQGRADGSLIRNTTSEVFVVAPSLVAELDGPGLRYLGRNATYTLRVRNDGEIAVENVRLMHKVPEGFEVVETDRGAQFDRPNRLVNWFVGRLTAGQTSEMKVTMRADQIGSFTHFVRATSEHGAISDTQFTTQVEGTPSLAMQIRDLEDPVEIGGETAYEIVVKNEGSAAARHVSLVCEIPVGLEVVKAQGPVDSIKQRDLVTFNPVIELAPGNSITYRIQVRGQVAGHHRVRARLSSEATPEPLTADELTRFYGE